MTRRYPDLASASDWLKQIFSQSDPRVVTRHQHGISVLISQTSLREETNDDVAKCQLFSHAGERCTRLQTCRTECTSYPFSCIKCITIPDLAANNFSLCPRSPFKSDKTEKLWHNLFYH